MGTYSFNDVNCTLVGPGGSIQLGAGAGAADEGISIDMIEEKNTMTIGADGTPMHSLHAGKGAKVRVRLLKTSPTNNLLSEMYAIQTISSAAHGINVISVRDPINGDSITAAYVAFAKLPNITYAKEAGMQEWEFDAGVIDTSLGGGLLANLASFGAGAV